MDSVKDGFKFSRFGKVFGLGAACSKVSRFQSVIVCRESLNSLTCKILLDQIPQGDRSLYLKFKRFGMRGISFFVPRTQGFVCFCSDSSNYFRSFPHRGFFPAKAEVFALGNPCA